MAIPTERVFLLNWSTSLSQVTKCVSLLFLIAGVSSCLGGCDRSINSEQLQIPSVKLNFEPNGDDSEAYRSGWLECLDRFHSFYCKYKCDSQNGASMSDGPLSENSLLVLRPTSDFINRAKGFGECKKRLKLLVDQFGIDAVKSDLVITGLSAEQFLLSEYEEKASHEICW